MTKRKSPTKKFTKVLEQVKNDEGEIINIKETKIEIEIEKEEAPIFEEISKRTKLKNLKNTLLNRLKEERIERYKDEQKELKAAAENDENFYLEENSKISKKMGHNFRFFFFKDLVGLSFRVYLQNCRSFESNEKPEVPGKPEVKRKMRL